MIPKVKLRSSILLGGVVYNRDKVIRRSLIEGTRFESEEFIIEQDDPEFHKPAWDDKVEVSTEVNQEVTGDQKRTKLLRYLDLSDDH
jgi:hypothetical protein